MFTVIGLFYCYKNDRLLHLITAGYMRPLGLIFPAGRRICSTGDIYGRGSSPGVWWSSCRPSPYSASFAHSISAGILCASPRASTSSCSTVIS